MKTLVCQAPGELSLQDLDAPQTPDGWIAVDIRAVGICGTDYHIFKGRQPYLSYPRVMGHELSGTIAQDVEDAEFRPGQRVIIDPYIACGYCAACRKGKNNCCENISVLGVHRDGGMRPRIAVPRQNIISADGLTFQQAAMVEFMSIGRHAVARTAVVPGVSVLVVGGGPIGLAAALFARLEGCAVSMADISPHRAGMLAERFGFDVVDPGENATRKRLSRGFEHVFEATGSIQAINSGLDYMAHGGTYTLLSVVQGDIQFSDPEFHKRETTLLASRNAQKSDFTFVIDAMTTGRIDTDLLATHHTTLQKAVTDIPVWADDRGTVIKAIIEMEQ